MNPPFIGSIFVITLLVWQGILSADSLSNEDFLTEIEAESGEIVSATVSPTPTLSPDPQSKPTPTPQPSPSPKASPSPTPEELPASSPDPDSQEDCDFEYHYDSEQDGPLEDGEISIKHHCREELNNGSASNNLDIQIDTGNNSNQSGKVKIDVKVDNR